MNFYEALITLIQNPGHIALLGSDRALTTNPNGALMSLSGSKPDYARVFLTDIVATTWEVMSPEALEVRARQNAQGE